MTYKAMAAPERRRVRFPVPSGGMDYRASPDKRDTAFLEEGLNVWWEGEALRTRPAVKAVGYLARKPAARFHPLAELQEESAAGSWWTQAYTENGEPRLNVYQIDPDGQATPLGREPLAASYAIITADVGGWLAITDSGWYRLPGRQGLWTHCENQAYVPVVMRHAKGCLSSEIKPPEGEPYEQYNRLTDRFSATYTTDGVATRFYLPQNGLSDEVITAEYTGPDGRRVVHTIAAGENQGATGDDGQILRVDRLAGYVQFKDRSQNTDWAPPACGREDNLTITASKNGVSGHMLIQGMRQGLWYGGDQNRAALFLTGNPDDPALLCWSAPGDPLYIPFSHFTRVGDSYSAISAMARLGRQIIIFKERGLFAMSETNVLETGRRRFPIAALPGRKGCVLPDTIRGGGGFLLWLDAEGQVCCLTAGALHDKREPAVLSDPVQPLLNTVASADWSQASAVWWRGHYLLCTGHRIWVLRPGNGETPPVWHYWELDERLEPAGWAAQSGTLTLICRDTEGSEPVWRVYTVDPEDSRDILCLRGQRVIQAIPFHLRTRLWDAGYPGRQKRFEQAQPVWKLPPRSILTLLTERDAPSAGQRISAVGGGRMLPLRTGPAELAGLDITGAGELLWRDLFLTLSLYREVRR